MEATESSETVTLYISADEWRDITTWMYASLGFDEHSPSGHFLLECEGSKRTWVTSDGEQTTVVNSSGTTPHGLSDPTERFTVLVNSRFFRHRSPVDSTLRVTTSEGGRRQTLITDEVEMTLPEHPAEFCDWRSILSAVSGESVEVDTGMFREACTAASVVPLGAGSADAVHAWVSIQDGRVHLESPWIEYPSTVIDVPVLTSAIDTVPVLIDVKRLVSLLEPIDLGRTTLRLPRDPLLPVGLSAGDFEAVLMPTDRWGGERRRLEELLCEFLQLESVSTDDDGDYPVATPEGHDLYVRLHTASEPVCVQVFSVLASNVDPSPELFEELNSINSSAAHVKVLWAGRAVMAEVDLVAGTLDPAEIANALEVVRHTADRFHGILAAFFGSFDSTPTEGS